jgi:hypothetical protein
MNGTFRQDFSRLPQAYGAASKKYGLEADSEMV